MSASMGNGSGQEVELNITPIIDCFTVLITFLLASASFLSIGFFEVVTPGTTADASTLEPDVEVILKVSNNQMVEMKLKGKRNSVVRFELNNPKELEKLEKEIEGIKEAKLSVNQILITAENEVPYQNMAKVMDALQKSALPSSKMLAINSRTCQPVRLLTPRSAVMCASSIDWLANQAESQPNYGQCCATRAVSGRTTVVWPR